MPVLPLTLPTIQNWSCHNCSGCCRQHLIELSDAERQRIVDQNWTSADGITEGQPVIEPHAGPPWKKRYRLAHRDDGACVFLNDDGLCRIHAKFGEAAKPLACRIYPYAFHPACATGDSKCGTPKVRRESRPPRRNRVVHRTHLHCSTGFSPSVKDD